MTRIDFYFNAADKLEVARKLAAKVYQAGQKALLYTTDEALANSLDAAIWTHDKLSFIPHVRCGHPLATDTPILIGSNPDALAAHDVLINLDAACPACFSRFERLLEVVSVDDADRQAARERFRYYKDRGYALKTNDLAAK